MAPKTMKRYTIAHRNGIDGLKLETDAPVPELLSPTDVSRPLSQQALESSSDLSDTHQHQVHRPQ